MTGPVQVLDASYKSPSKARFFSTSCRNVGDSDLFANARQMVETLTEDDSFRYLWRSVRQELCPKDLKEERDFYATKMAQRHLASKKQNFDLALQKMKSAIKFRKDNDLDGLRLCFHDEEIPSLDAETRARYAVYRERLEERMTAGRVYVQGYDKHGRAIYTIFAARTKDFEPEWFLKESLYNFERAIACTERESNGREESILVIGNYTGFQSKHAAPMSLSNEFMDVLRQNYPGRVKRVFLLNTPTTFLFFWSILKPFIGTETRKKIQFISSEKQREKEFGELVSLEQAAPWMRTGGKKTRELDVKQYLRETSFEQGFDA
jgi:hypothetical protein